MQEIYKDSLRPDHWYFFAVTGINITQKLIRNLRQGTFDQSLLTYLSSAEGGSMLNIETLHELIDFWYFKMFSTFNSQWRNSKVDIMEFNHYFERVFDIDFMMDHDKLLKEFFKEKQANKKND